MTNGDSSLFADRVRPAAARLVALALVALALAPSAASAEIFWANGDSIARANLDGTGVDQSFITGALNPGGIAVDADHLY